MDEASRRWVLKSLSPPLDPRNLRSMTGPGRGEDDFRAPDSPAPQARPLVVSPDSGDERPPDSPGGSSGSRDGFYSFVEDPTSPEAELNEAWMLSPQRQVHLTTLKEDRAFKVQSYASGKKTESLFPDSDSPYRVRPESCHRTFGEEEEKQLRKEIIQKQAPKRKPTLKPSERPGGPEKLDRSGPTSTPTKGSGPVDGPGVIDGARIDFGAARQQFLDLEQGGRDVLVHPRRSRVSRKMEGEDVTRAQTKNGQTSGPSGAPSDLSEEACPRSVGGEDAFDDGVLQTTGKAKSDDGDETPIEKEIRLLQEREQNLRRARGLQRTDGFSELLQIESGRARSLPSPRKKKGHGSFAVQLESREKNGGWKGPGELLDPRKEEREALLPPCCPHRHAQETSSSTLSPTMPPPPRHVPSWAAPLSLRSNQESASSERGKKSAPDFIEEEIEEALLRERELRESRRAREFKRDGEPGECGGSGWPTGSGLRSATPLVEWASKATAALVEAAERAGPSGAPPRDSDERRERREAQDGSYAGIRAVDDVNNQVVESTRVIRHKSQRALRWEAGLFANRR